MMRSKMRFLGVRALGLLAICLPFLLSTALCAASPYPNISRVSSANRHQDLNVIFEFIRTEHRAIPSQDARLIATRLVEDGNKYQIDPKFVASVVSVESGFNRKATYYGATGLGQLMPSTWRALGLTNPFSVTQNVDGTTRYLKEALSKWEGQDRQAHLTLASYIIGPMRVGPKREFSGRVNRYIRNVLSRYERMQERS